MKLNKKNKTIIIIFIVILIILIIGLCIYNISIDLIKNTLKSNAYIDIWRDISMDADIDLYSTGSGINEKLYMGSQPTHYLINENGKIYTYQDSSYQNKITGKRDPATVKYIKQLSQSNLENLKSDLQLIIQNNANNDNDFDYKWYIKINGETTTVYVNLLTQVLNNYI